MWDDAGGKPHCENEEEIEDTPEQEPFFAQGVAAQNRSYQGKNRSEKGQEKGVGIVRPKAVVFEYRLEGKELDLFRKQNNPVSVDVVLAADRGRNRVNEGI